MPKISAPTVAEHRASRRESLLRAGEAVLREEGLAGVTPRSVCERAGLSRSSVHTNNRSYAVCLGDIAPASVTLDISGVADGSSGLKPDYPGGVDALEGVSSLARSRVTDLYEQQRRLKQ